MSRTTADALALVNWKHGEPLRIGPMPVMPTRTGARTDQTRRRRHARCRTRGTELQP